MKTLLITSCTNEKRYSPNNLLTKIDFENDSTLHSRISELSSYKTHAIDMYTGQQHQQLLLGISELRKHFSNDCISIKILSAGYGIVDENTDIVPYECSFNTMTSSEIKKWSNYLNIESDLTKIFQNETYDYAIFLLGDNYLKSIQNWLHYYNGKCRLIFISSSFIDKCVNSNKNICKIKLSSYDATLYSYGIIGLKGYVFRCFCNECVENNKLMYDELFFKHINFDRYKKSSTEFSKLREKFGFVKDRVVDDMFKTELLWEDLI